jgi:3',5'-cyclic AMP phosphodiesterase CpdA
VPNASAQNRLFFAMPLITRRTFTKTAAAALPLLLGRQRAMAAASEAADQAVGTLPSGVSRVPLTPFNAPPGSWSLVSIPDSQHDAAFYPEVFQRQMEWIAAHKDEHHIRMALHEGDVTDDNGARQWDRVRKAMDALKQARVPYSITTGNHDVELVNGKAVSRMTQLNDFFSESDYAQSAAFGVYQLGRVENSWHEFESSWGRMLVLSLEFGAPREVLQWARDTIADHRPRRTVLVTHAYLHQDGTRYDYDAKGESQSATPRSYPIPRITDGEIIWRELVSKEDSLRLVLCGHTIGNGAAYLASRNEAGNVCHQVMANYQMQVRPARGHGSGGFLLLLQFQPDQKTVQLKTYSPWYNVWLHGPAQELAIDLS